MRDCGIIDAFQILGSSKLQESSIKIWSMMLMFQDWSLKFRSVLVFYEIFKWDSFLSSIQVA